MNGIEERVIRANETGWEGVDREGYRPGAAEGVERHTILGHRKVSADEPGPSLEVRYFELQPGAVSRLEKHEHEHYVIVRRGLGYAVVGERLHRIGPNDVIYVAPMELHQFVNRADEPFGFYCIVSAMRDVPQEPAPEEVESLMQSPAGRVARPFAVPLPEGLRGRPSP